MRAILILLFVGGITLSAADKGAGNRPRTPAPPPGRPDKASINERRQRPAKPRPKLVYKPPRLKAPKVSTGPGTRGGGSDPIFLAVLAPDHAGLTTLEQPSLYWFQSKEPPHLVEITVVIPGDPEPVLEHQFAIAPPAGLHRIDLKEHGVRLREGVNYRWSVAIVADPGQRSKDIVASGVIERAPQQPALGPANEGSIDSWDRARAAAGLGLWHDALADLENLGPPEKWEGFAQLARQVGLDELADYCDHQPPEP